MDHVVGSVAPFEGFSEALGIESIRRNDLDFVAPWIQRELGRIARHTSHLEALIEESRHEPTSDIAGCTGNEDLHDAECSKTVHGSQCRNLLTVN